MKKYVNVIALNIQATPADSSKTLGALQLGDQVEALDTDASGRHRVRAVVNGTDLIGFVEPTLPKAKVTWPAPAVPTLREPASDAREALVAAAVAQWVRFDHGTGEESKKPFSEFIGEMWAVFKTKNDRGKPLDGTDRDWPWSAVAISWIVAQAAKNDPRYQSFRGAIRHSSYMWDAIQANAKADTAAPFWGVRLSMAQPQVGDIIGNWRNSKRTYDDYLESTQPMQAEGHTDIVVAVSPQVAWAIGGNVGQPRRPDPGKTVPIAREQTLGITGYQLTVGGFLMENKRMDANGVVKGEAIVLMDNRL